MVEKTNKERLQGLMAVAKKQKNGLLIITPDSVTLHADYDKDVHTIIKLDVPMQTDGAVRVDAKDFAKKWKDGSTLKVTEKGVMMYNKAGALDGAVQASNVDITAELWHTAEGEHIGTVTIGEVFRRVMPHACMDDLRPAMKTVLADFSHQTLVATDAHALIFEQGAVTKEQEGKVVIPTYLAELAKEATYKVSYATIKEEKKDVVNSATLTNDDFSIIIKQLSYVNYTVVIPDFTRVPSATMGASRKYLLEQLKEHLAKVRTTIVEATGDNITAHSVENHLITLMVVSKEVSYLITRLEDFRLEAIKTPLTELVGVDGEMQVISAFNAKLLKRVLNSLGEDKVSMQLHAENNMRPMVVNDKALIMPVEWTELKSK